MRFTPILFLLTALGSQAQVSIPKQATQVSVPNDLIIQMERQSGDIRVLSARFEGLQNATTGSFQRIEQDLQKNRDQHQEFERRIDELHSDFRIYPWLFGVLGGAVTLIGQHLLSRFLKSKLPDGRPPAEGRAAPQ